MAGLLLLGDELVLLELFVVEVELLRELSYAFYLIYDSRMELEHVLEDFVCLQDGAQVLAALLVFSAAGLLESELRQGVVHEPDLRDVVGE